MRFAEAYLSNHEIGFWAVSSRNSSPSGARSRWRSLGARLADFFLGTGLGRSMSASAAGALAGCSRGVPLERLLAAVEVCRSAHHMKV